MSFGVEWAKELHRQRPPQMKDRLMRDVISKKGRKGKTGRKDLMKASQASGVSLSAKGVVALRLGRGGGRTKLTYIIWGHGHRCR